MPAADDRKRSAEFAFSNKQQQLEDSVQCRPSRHRWKQVYNVKQSQARQPELVCERMNDITVYSITDVGLKTVVEGG